MLANTEPQRLSEIISATYSMSKLFFEKKSKNNNVSLVKIAQKFKATLKKTPILMFQ